MREGSGTPRLVGGEESGRCCSGMGHILRGGGVGGVGARDDLTTVGISATMRPVSPNAKFHAEHRELIEAVQRLLQHMESLRWRLRSQNKISYGHYDDFTDRINSLTIYLKGAMLLAEYALYAPGLAVIRSAFEHQQIDRMMFRSDKRIPVETHAEIDKYSLPLYHILVNAPREKEGNGKIWNRWFREKILQKKMREEDIISEKEAVQMTKHYDFLCRYSHPDSSDVHLKREYDHCASELIILYVCQFSIWELQDFRAVTRINPVMDIEGWSDVEQDIRDACDHISHAWFPGQRPHDRDRYNKAISQIIDSDNQGRFNSIDFSSIRDDEIRYYDDPLQRLRKLHRSETDVVGTYRPPWLRTD